MLMQRQCECGNLFWTTRGPSYACPTCRRSFQKSRAREMRRWREFVAPGSHTETEWLAQINRQLNLCFWCSLPLRDEEGNWRGTRDHLTPLAKGGTDNIDNIVAACWPCNRAKGNRTEGEYRLYLSRQKKTVFHISALPSSENLPFSAKNLPPNLRRGFQELLAQKEMAALVFQGVETSPLTERRKKLQSQNVELSRRRA
jgi:5-methylcytosine-specific restriction endonuclease McrA